MENQAICAICGKPAGTYVAGNPRISHYACMVELLGCNKGEDYNEAVLRREKQIEKK